MSLQTSEQLFWSVFRNIVLKEKIFQLLKTKFRLGVYSYYEINDSYFIMQNGHLNLLKDKLAKNDKDLIIDERIFNYFKNDSLIFVEIFKKYPKLINEVDKIIQSFNLAAFEVLVKEFNYIPTELNLIESIKCGSFQISIFIISNCSPNSFEITNETKDKIWRESIGYEATIKRRVQYHLVNNELHLNKCNFFIKTFINGGDESYSTLPEPIEMDSKYLSLDIHLLFVSNGKSIGDKYYKNIKCLFKMFIYEKSLRFVLDCCFLLSTILKLQKQIQERPEFILTEDELKELKFSDKELNSKIGELDSNNIQFKKLFIMLLYFTNDFPMGENYNFLEMKYYNGLDRFPKLFNPIDFGTYNGESIFKRPIHEIPFKYCKNDKNGGIIIEFIQKSIKDLMDPTIETRSKFSINKLLETCFLYNDLEIVKMIFDSLFLTNQNSFSLDTFTKIQSKPIFDYVFNKLKTNERKIESFKYIIKNHELANHFKVNYSDYYYQSVYTFSKINGCPSYELSNKFIYENWTDFSIEQFDPSEHMNNLIYHFTIINPKEIDQLKKVPESITKIYYLHRIGDSAAIQSNYIIDNRINDVYNGFFSIPNNDLLFIGYLRNQLKEYLDSKFIRIKKDRPLEINGEFFSLNKELTKRNDIKTLEFLLDYFSNDPQILEHLNSTFSLSKLLKKLKNKNVNC